MDRRTAKAIDGNFRHHYAVMGRPQSGVVVTASPLAIFTGERDDAGDPIPEAYIVQPKKLLGWVPVIGEEVMLMRVQNAVWAYPVEDS